MLHSFVEIDSVKKQYTDIKIDAVRPLSQSPSPTSNVWTRMQDAYFSSCCLILYVITKLHMEGLSKDIGDIKRNELLMLKHLISLYPSPLSPIRRHRLLQLSLLLCLRFIFLMYHITIYSRCWDFQYIIKTITADLKWIFPPTYRIFLI